MSKTRKRLKFVGINLVHIVGFSMVECIYINYNYHIIIISLIIVLVYMVSVGTGPCQKFPTKWKVSDFNKHTITCVLSSKNAGLSIKKQVGLCSFFYSIIEYHLLHSCICLVLIFPVVASIITHCCISFTPVLRKGFFVVGGGLFGSLTVSLVYCVQHGLVLVIVW